YNVHRGERNSVSITIPYTTLFRTPWSAQIRAVSAAVLAAIAVWGLVGIRRRPESAPDLGVRRSDLIGNYLRFLGITIINPLTVRSEEHTSELQSRENLVCSLLLVK